MKRIWLAVLAVLTLGTAAHAQDASQIARVQSGQSCPGCNLFQADLSYLDLPGIDVSGSRLRQASLALWGEATRSRQRDPSLLPMARSSAGAAGASPAKKGPLPESPP